MLHEKQPNFVKNYQFWQHCFSKENNTNLNSGNFDSQTTAALYRLALFKAAKNYIKLANPIA